MAHIVTSQCVPCTNSPLPLKIIFNHHNCITLKKLGFLAFFKMAHIGPFFVKGLYEGGRTCAAQLILLSKLFNRMFKKSIHTGCLIMFRCKACEIMRNEAYFPYAAAKHDERNAEDGRFSTAVNTIFSLWETKGAYE
jgi:hypothetical protein